MKKLILKKTEVLVLRRNIKGMKSYRGFTYPKKGMVEATDWKSNHMCGNGLHGWLWGEGSYRDDSLMGLFMLLKVNKSNLRRIDGNKIKFKKGSVIQVSNSPDRLIDIILSVRPESKCNNSTSNQGHDSTSNQGDCSTSNQGGCSTSNQGDDSASNQGYSSTNNQGEYSTSNQGDCSTSNQGTHSTGNQGTHSTNNQGDDSASNQEEYSTSNQGEYSTSNQGEYSTSNQEEYSTSNQGEYSTSNQGYSSINNQGGYSTSNQGAYSTSNQRGYSTSNQGEQSVAVARGSDYIYRGSHLSLCILFYKNERHIFDKCEKGKTYKIQNCKIIKEYTTTPDNIEKLEDYEVFVFGSNLKGEHLAGAAKTAKELFGAEEGVPEGLIGQSYAFPTLYKNGDKVLEDDFKKSIQQLINCANTHTTKIFLVTKVGCGIAGFLEKEVEGYFKQFKNKLSANIILPWIF